MTLVELRCTRCDAPVEASSATVLTCRYCGATMAREPAVGIPASSPGHIAYFLKIGRIGPSNRPRVAKLISEHASMSIEAAMKLVETYPNEVPFDREESRARDVASQIIDAGGQAEVVDRWAGDPILPSRAVHLDDAGPHHVAAIKVVREYLDLGMLEAKHLVDSAPCVLTKAMEGGRAKSFHDALVNAGASARIS
jgi:ribosomal protein L7/L12